MSLRSGYDLPQPVMQFCALAYNGKQTDPCALTGTQVIIFLIYNPATGARLLTAPDWQRLVHSSDHVYIKELLADFRERAQSDPETLLVQISSLSTGPLLTHTCGIRLEDFPDLLALSRTFEEA
jgi:hypothetical protein